MRFERLGVTPVAVVEIEIEGATVTTREGAGAATRTFASEAAARAHVDARASELRGQGYVQIKRIAAVAPEQGVRRSKRFEWVENGKPVHREITQRDEVVRISEGAHVEPQIHRAFKIQDASADFDRACAAAQREIDEAAAAVKRAKQKAAVRRRKRDDLADQTNLELEAQCRASPDDAAVWQVYADWLIERGSALGEVAALALGGDYKAAVHAAVDHFEALDTSPAAHIVIELRHGFVRGVTIESRASARFAQAVAGVIASPACRFLERVTLRSDDSEPAPWQAAIAALASGRIAELDIGLEIDRDDEYIEFGSFDFRALPLASLRIGGGRGANARLPALHTYLRDTRCFDRRELVALCESPHPALVHLEVSTGIARSGSDVVAEDFDRLLEGSAFPALRHLGIRDTDVTADLIPRLAASKLLPRLESLDLQAGNCGDVRALVRHARAFRHLAAIDLSENRIDDIERLRGALDNVITNNQHARFDALGE